MDLLQNAGQLKINRKLFSNCVNDFTKVFAPRGRRSVYNGSTKCLPKFVKIWAEEPAFSRKKCYDDAMDSTTKNVPFVYKVFS